MNKLFRNRQNSGITLIALVITIVVLLVLAGVSINLILGENGLIQKTKDARIATKMGEIEDYGTLKIAELYIDNADNMDNVNEATITTALKAELQDKGYETRDVNTTSETVNGLKILDSTGTNNFESLSLQQQQNTTIKVGLDTQSQLTSSKTYVKIYDDWYELLISTEEVKVSKEKYEEPEETGNTYEIKLTPPASGITMTAAGKPITSETAITPDTLIVVQAANTTGDFTFNVKETVSSKSRNVTVTVSANPLYATALSISLSETGATAEITPGGTLQLKAVKTPSTSSDTILWSIKSGSATIDQTGLVTANSDAVADSTIVVAANCKRSDNTTTTVTEKTLPITVKSAGGLSVGSIVDTSTTRVGYYADLTGDGTVDGIIYADLAFSVSGQWGDSDGKYSYTKQTGLKEYVITKAKYNDRYFGDAPVITPKSGTSGNDRFYVMALRDIGGYYYWDKNFDSSYNSKKYGTSYAFGKGRSNTKTMVEYWDNPSNIVEKPPIYKDVYEDVWVEGSGSEEGHYESQYKETIEVKEYISDWDSNDIWYNIKNQYNNGWFVPSRAEWAAFAKNLGITKYNYYKTFGLHDLYGSSSQNTVNGYTHRAWSANFLNGTMNSFDIVNHKHDYVRLSTTF